MIPVNGLTATGLLLLLFLALLVPACSLISREHDRRVVFAEPVTVPGPGMCGCGAPKCTPPEAPFPGDEPAYLPAPAAPAKPAYVVAEIGHDGDVDAYLDSKWNKAEAARLRERLRAEEAEEALS